MSIPVTACSSTTLDTIPHAVFYRQYERLEELNERTRNYVLPPTEPLEIHYDPRPVSTKYVVFPTWDPLNEDHEPLTSLYVPHQQFYTGDRRAPSNGYRVHIEEENRLKNLGISWQRGASNSTYVPSLQNQTPIQTISPFQLSSYLETRGSVTTTGQSFLPTSSSSTSKSLFNQNTHAK